MALPGAVTQTFIFQGLERVLALCFWGAGVRCSSPLLTSTVKRGSAFLPACPPFPSYPGPTTTSAQVVNALPAPLPLPHFIAC